MKTLILLLSFVLPMCSTTRPAAKHHTAAHGKMTVVDSTWIATYKAKEEQYGYRVDQDSQIKSVGGKYRVPQEVIDHNLDLQKAKQQ